MLETWRPVVGYETRYEVSDLGRVRSLTVRTHRRLIYGRILKQSPNRGGYPCVCLQTGSKGKYCKVHKLVAAAFLGPCPAGKGVAHNDGTRTNNAAANLRYATQKENCADRMRHSTSPAGERSPHAKLTNAQVLRIRALAGVKTQTELAQQFGVRQNTISMIQSRRRWAHI